MLLCGRQQLLLNRLPVIKPVLRKAGVKPYGGSRCIPSTVHAQCFVEEHAVDLEEQVLEEQSVEEPQPPVAIEKLYTYHQWHSHVCHDDIGLLQLGETGSLVLPFAETPPDVLEACRVLAVSRGLSCAVQHGQGRQAYIITTTDRTAESIHFTAPWTKEQFLARLSLITPTTSLTVKVLHASVHELEERLQAAQLQAHVSADEHHLVNVQITPSMASTELDSNPVRIWTENAADLSYLTDQYYAMQSQHGFGVRLVSPGAMYGALGQGTFTTEALYKNYAHFLPPPDTAEITPGSNTPALSQQSTSESGVKQRRRRDGADDDGGVTWDLDSSSPGASSRGFQVDEDEDGSLKSLLAELGVDNYLEALTRMQTQRQQLEAMRRRRPARVRPTAAQVRRSKALLARESAKARNAGWRKMVDRRKELPAWSMRQEVLQMIQDNQVVIVTGETGCGKSTQLPQFLLEDAIAKGQGGSVNIVVTQPRRISAKSLAERVSKERCEQLGDVVGYKVRTEYQITSNTRLTFCTAGILLRKLMIDPDLEDVTHVLLDEVHERSTNTDFLLIALREVLTRRPDLKVVLMSATVQPEAFSMYFDGCPLLFIPGRTFPVEELYLEDVLQLTGYKMHNGKGALRAHALLKQYQDAVAGQADVAGAAGSPRAPTISPKPIKQFSGTKKRKKDVQGAGGHHDVEFGNVEVRDWYGEYRLQKEDFKQADDRVKQQLGRYFDQVHNKVDPYLAAVAVRYIDAHFPKDGAILVIMSGWADINEVMTLLTCGIDDFLALHALKRPALLSQVEADDEQGQQLDSTSRGNSRSAAGARGARGGLSGAAVAGAATATAAADGGTAVAGPAVARAAAAGGGGAAAAYGADRSDLQQPGTYSLGSSMDGSGTRFGDQQVDLAVGPAVVPVVDGLWVLPLHSGLSLAEQHRVFEKPPDGARKVIVATNIAESSITIPDVVYVVDGGRSKQIDYDPVTELQVLSRQWISQASAKQRAGRAGRVQPGICFRLFPQPFHDKHMAPYDTPELQRIPLEGLCLQVLSMGLAGGRPTDFLLKALDPPRIESIDKALTMLSNLGAITPLEQQHTGNDGAWTLTPLGSCLAQLPLEPRVGKMLVVASTLGVLDPVLTIAAGLSAGSPFNINFTWPAF